MRKGFTFFELMVVIVIIGILASLAVPRILGHRRGIDNVNTNTSRTSGGGVINHTRW